MPVGRKRQQGKRTIRRICEAASKLFVIKGYHGTSMAAIAKECGLTTGALYRHFDSKSDLLLSLLDKWESDFLEGFIETVSGSTNDAVTKLEHMLKYASYSVANNRELLLLMVIITAEVFEVDKQFNREINRIMKRYTRALGRFVEEGKAQHQFRIDMSTDDMIMAILSINEGLLLQWQRNRKNLNPKEFARLHRQIILDTVIRQVPVEG